MTSVTTMTARLNRVGIPGTLTCSPPLTYSVSQPAKNSSPYCPPWEEPNPKAEKHGESYIDRAFALRRFTESAGAKHHVEQQDCHRHTQDDEPLELGYVHQGPPVVANAGLFHRDGAVRGAVVR